MSKKGLKHRVLEYLQGGDERNLGKFIDILYEVLPEQVEGANKDIKDLKRDISDVDGEIESSLLNIDMERIGTNAARKAYAIQYLKNLDTLFVRREKLKFDIEKKEIIIGWRKEQKELLDKAGSEITDQKSE